MAAFYDAFISYSRSDSKAFVIDLKDRLKGAGLAQIWLDLDDIPSATDWQQRIDDAIERAHHFVYVISPTAIASRYCRIELALAIKYGKRIVPLMHVDGTDRSVWEQHDLDGCTTVRKLNWIFFREGQDDPAVAFRNLCHTLRYCDRNTGKENAAVKHYVQQHTTLLVQALTWDRQHRQNRYLLVGTERQVAEAWLQTASIDGEQLPCTPTDLQCEFITESTKNANNLMTQAFLCHAEEDQATAEQLRRSLLRRGITVWNYRTDIQTSQDYNAAITRGIEEADNILFILSPQSAQSPYCQRELQQALDLHKRIIPVLAAPTEPEQVPESLKSLQYVDLTDNTQETDYLADESQLLKLLDTDAAYHTEHKTWLVQALKWQRQHQNPTLLLRGYNLRRAETWLKVARTHRHPPTELHDQFIAESLRQPPDSSLDVFISYSRVDSDFARRLNEALQIQGKRTWFDQESIASGSDFQQEIYRGIESSDVFVFVLSPQSVNSPFCADEVEYANGLNKRMVTVLHRPIDTADLHPVLAKLQWLDFSVDTDKDFSTSFRELIRALDTDIDYLRVHTRLLTKAIEWKKENYDRSFLLRGKELAASQKWLEQSEHKQPSPTKLQIDFIISSLGPLYYLKASQGERIKFLTLGFTSATVTVLVFLARLVGLMQPAEFMAYDVLMRQRPAEPPDPRMLLITVDESSSSWLRENIIGGRYQAGLDTIPEEALEEALAILLNHNPAVIGLNFYRDFPASPELATRLLQTDKFVGLCQATHQNIGSSGVNPPPELPIDRVGFNDFVIDGNAFVRRHYLKQSADSTCATDEAFSLKLARSYLAQKGIDYVDPWASGNEVQDMAFGSTRIPQLWAGGVLVSNSVAYSPLIQPEILNGYQTMLNYRIASYGDLSKFAPKISLKDLLTNRFNPQIIQDRIVLIGYQNIADRNAFLYNTPYGVADGVVLQGQMVSQLVSAVLDGRPLIWWWPIWGETIWIFSWSAIGGVTFWWLRGQRLLLLAVSAELITLSFICYWAMLLSSGWIPLVPAAVAMLLTGLCVNYFTSRLRLKKLIETNQKLLEASRS